MIAVWPQVSGGEEYAVSFDRERAHRVLVVPALFDEANKTRHLIVETMRRLDGADIDSFLPDLPGCNESTLPLKEQTLADWRSAMLVASNHFRASHVLTIRAGAILAPPMLSGWRYAPTSGAGALRALLRAKILAAREAGQDATSESLLQLGRTEGLELAGHYLGAEMICGLERAHLPDSGRLSDITQGTIGGGGAWLRAEPDFDATQADALAAMITISLSAGAD